MILYLKNYTRYRSITKKLVLGDEVTRDNGRLESRRKTAQVKESTNGGMTSFEVMGWEVINPRWSTPVGKFYLLCFLQ